MGKYDEIIDKYLDAGEFDFNADLLYLQYKDRCADSGIDETGNLYNPTVEAAPGDEWPPDGIIPELMECAYSFFDR